MNNRPMKVLDIRKSMKAIRSYESSMLNSVYINRLSIYMRNRDSITYRGNIFSLPQSVQACCKVHPAPLSTGKVTKRSGSEGDLSPPPSVAVTMDGAVHMNL
jgi:hypothetical protein